MELLFVHDNGNEYFLIEKNRPNWVLKVMCFHSQSEIDVFCKATGADKYGKQITGYYMYVVFLNTIADLTKEEFKYYHQPFPEKSMLHFRLLFKDFYLNFFQLHLRKFYSYKIH